MLRNSITIRLLVIIAVSFVFTTVSVLILADRQLTHVIDVSQEALYHEKLQSINDFLFRSNQRLKKTGMVEAYINDFQKAALNDLRQAHYKKGAQLIFPFIIDMQGRVIMSPLHASEGEILSNSEIVKKMLAAKSGDFNYFTDGQGKWCLFRHFPEWNWVVGYTVPLNIKYGDALRFRYLLAVIMAGISFLVLSVLVLVIRKFTRPIIRLTNIATSMAEGDLEQHIDLPGDDEVGRLALSFKSMRDSVHQTIVQLEREIGERRRVEESLLQQNEYIGSILESVAHPLYAIDVHDYTVKLGNSASGFKVDHATTCYALSHNSDVPCNESEHPCPLSIVKKTHKPTMVEHIHYDDLDKRNVEVYAYPVFDQQGELIQMIEYCIDITAKKVALDALATEKEQLAVTLRSIGDGVITTDVAGNIVLLNKVAEKLTGWSVKEAVGRPLEDVFHIINAQTREVCESLVTTVMNGGQIVGLLNQTVLISKDGRQRNIADSGTPILDSASNIIGVVLVFRDVTEQLKTEHELLKIKKIESVGILAGGIAHDFNNILAAILGNINLALFENNLPDNTKRLLLEAEKASIRAKDLTQQLLTFSKGGEPIKEAVSLKAIIVDSANFVLHGDKVACRYDIPDNLGLVHMDKGQIGQVIQNIVLNAAHSMPKGGIIEIHCVELSFIDRGEIPLARDGSFVRISIKDQGDGMSADVVERIFDPYFTTKRKGSGLGLAISQSIINKHGGYISVNSVPGIGTVFNVYLPLSAAIKEAPKAAVAEKISLESAKILIMDDDEMVRNVARAMLIQLGHDVFLAEDGRQALELYQEAMEMKKSFDLVIMDLTIPGGMGGKEAVREVLKISPHAKVVVSSGYSNDPIMARPQDYGFCMEIAKPFRIEDLSRVLGEVLDG